MDQLKFVVRKRSRLQGLSLAFGALAAVSACVGSVVDPGESSEGGAGPRSAGNGGNSGMAGSNGGGTVGSANGGGASNVDPQQGPAPASFACDAKATPPSTGMRRLTSTQYKNTLRDLTAWALGDKSATQTQAMQIMSSIAPTLARYPQDHRETSQADLHGSYRRLAQTLQQAHVEAGYDVAMAIGAQLTTSARLTTVAGSCATPTTTGATAKACIDDFIKRFGQRALRRPLTGDEVTFYATLYGDASKIDGAAFADVIGGLLTAPQFFYLVEHGDQSVQGKQDTYTLTSWEIASRLSYQFWETLPDDALFDAASKDMLKTPEQMSVQVGRLLADDRAKSTIDQFFTDYTKVEDLPALDGKNNDPTFKAFATADMMPTSTLKTNMIDDAVGMTRYYTWDKRGGMDDLLTSDLSFARTGDVAKIYGLAPWSGSGDPPKLPVGQRPGLFTRAAFLATGGVATRPIMKGVFLRRSVLCDGLPPPDNNAANTAIDTSDKTTRQAVEAITEQPNTACRSCHITMINGLGFATESFDALGRFRTEERLFSTAGIETKRVPVDTKTIARVIDPSDKREVANAADLMKQIAESGKATACLARNYFRFTFARFENLDVDGCALEALRKKVDKNGPIADMVREIAMLPEFRQRQFSQTATAP